VSNVKAFGHKLYTCNELSCFWIVFVEFNEKIDRQWIEMMNEYVGRFIEDIIG
jgi:hypothetical protein